MPLITGTLNNRRALIDCGLRPTLETVDGVQPVQSPFSMPIEPFKGLIDTGASLTCVTPRVAQKIGLVPRGKIPLGSVSDVRLHTTYSFVLGVWYSEQNGEPQNSTTGYFGFEPVLGCEIPEKIDFDVIIGMDIISQGDFTTNRLGEFTWKLY